MATANNTKPPIDGYVGSFEGQNDDRPEGLWRKARNNADHHRPDAGNMAECLQGHGFEIIRCTCLIVLVDGLEWFFRVRDARLHLAKEPLTGLR